MSNTYNMLNTYSKALKKVNQIVDGIRQKFENNRPLHIKRLSKDSTNPPETKKSLDFDNPSREISRESPSPFNVCVSAFTELLLVVGVISPIVPLSIFRAPTCSSGKSLGIVGRPMSSSTPKTPLEISERLITKTKVYLSVEYPSKTVRKE